MTESKVVAMVTALPAIQAIELPTDVKQTSIKAFIPSALNEIVMSYDWDFACDEADYPDGTVADQATYRLEGNKKDCRDIINVKYGDDYDLLDRMTPTDYDEFQTGRTISSVELWVPIERSLGFPQITLVGTPSAAGENIRYRYRRKDIKIEELPDEWGFVLVSAVAKWLYPPYAGVFMEDLKKMKDRYHAAGGEDAPAKLDPLTVSRNNNRSRLYGWS